MEIIALSGYARAGKDEAAKVLVEEFGFTQIAFADKLREFIYALNPLIDDIVYVVGPNGEFHPWNLGGEKVYLQDVINQYGWGGYKETPYGKEIRRLLQRLGTEGGRQVLWDTIWIDAAFHGLDPDGKYVVSDARFFNEFDAVRERGGEVWRIERKGVGPVSDHPSETEAPNYQHFALTITNYNGLEEYKEDIRRTYRTREVGKRLMKLATEAVV